MKKLFVGMGILFLLILSVIYFAIPGEIRVSKVDRIACTLNATVNYLTNENKWHFWWGKAQKTSDSIPAGMPTPTAFMLNGYQYTVTNTYFNAVEIQIRKEGFQATSRINIIPLGIDSMSVEWQTSIATGMNPFKKITSYQQAKMLHSNMEEILHHLTVFLEHRENIYGVDIQRTLVKDTLLVATRWIATHQPQTEEIYKQIDRLKQYVKRKGGEAIGYPMLNLRKADSGQFVTTVAIPTDKQLEGDNNLIFFKHMVPGNILETEINGGPATTAFAIQQVKNYIIDYREKEIAIPFESLVTDRRAEPDTNKWVTKIYFPIF